MVYDLAEPTTLAYTSLTLHFDVGVSEVYGRLFGQDVSKIVTILPHRFTLLALT